RCLSDWSSDVCSSDLGDRVFDAIAAAGGLSPDADMSKLPNLAGRRTDGEQVKVGFAKTTSGIAVARFNLNTATLEELETVPGFRSEERRVGKGCGAH